MIVIKIMEDEELQEVVKKFISSLLPHEGYDVSFFGPNLQNLFKYIHLDEFEMEYYVLLKVLTDLNSIRALNPGYVPRLSEETFEDILTNSIADSILDPVIGVKDWLKYERLNDNLQIETVKQDACQKLYARCVQLYSECFDLGVQSCNALDSVPALKAAFLAHVSNQVLVSQAKIIQGNQRIGRKNYTGANDWLAFTTNAVMEISARLQAAEDDVTFCVDTLEKSMSLLKGLKSLFIPIAKYGIPELDGDNGQVLTPILRHRFVVVAANENVGKTMFAKDQATNVLLAGGKVVYMCGENAKTKMYCEILISYIYKKYQCFVLPQHINDIDSCPENIKKIINMAIVEIMESKQLILRDAYSYDNVYEELKSDYDKYQPDAFFIDHSYALTGGYAGDNGKTNVDNLAKAVKSFRKQYPVYVMVLSHLSTGAKDAIERGKPIEGFPTKGSQNLSADADEVLVLRDDVNLRKEGLIALENTKRRDASKLDNYVILKKLFEVSHFEYNERYQATDTSLSIDADMALMNLENLYGSEGDEYSL